MVAYYLPICSLVSLQCYWKILLLAYYVWISAAPRCVRWNKGFCLNHKHIVWEILFIIEITIGTSFSGTACCVWCTFVALEFGWKHRLKNATT